jgi:NAD(P)-dependent dehydrogenase (short-subunit alcohol dehydrogenase family)
MNDAMRDRTVLVTGSTDGIGRAVAVAFAHAGASIVVTGRNASRGAEVVAQLQRLGAPVLFVEVDLAAGAAAARDLAARALQLTGTVDVLVNNAAMLITPGATADVTEQAIDAAFAVNVRAAFLLTGLLAPRMAERGSGAVVNIGSINGLIGMAGSALYSATKATIHSLTRSWAAEYGPSGVRVNTVAPGPVLTDRIIGSAAMQARLAPMIERFPSGRGSTPEEVAASVLFLAGDDAANIHGALLSVDGGRAAI